MQRRQWFKSILAGLTGLPLLRDRQMGSHDAAHPMCDFVVLRLGPRRVCLYPHEALRVPDSMDYDGHRWVHVVFTGTELHYTIGRGRGEMFQKHTIWPVDSTLVYPVWPVLGWGDDL